MIKEFLNAQLNKGLNFVSSLWDKVLSFVRLAIESPINKAKQWIEANPIWTAVIVVAAAVVAIFTAPTWVGALGSVAGKLTSVVFGTARSVLRVPGKIIKGIKTAA